MATWTVSDELDARLRQHLGNEDPAAFAECMLNDHLDIEEDPAYVAELDRQIKQSRAELDAGLGVDAREAMRQIVARKRINLDR